MNSPEQRLAALEATSRIQALAHGYAHAYARLDVAALTRLYSPDVELLDGSWGRAALAAHFERGIRQAPGQGLDTVVLHTGDHVIDLVAADRATGTVYCHVEVLLRDGTGYYQAVQYSDSYVALDGEWFFARQRTHELVVGAPLTTRPNGLPEAHWPTSQVGRGTVPHRLASWQHFWSTGPR